MVHSFISVALENLCGAILLIPCWTLGPRLFPSDDVLQEGPTCSTIMVQEIEGKNLFKCGRIQMSENGSNTSELHSQRN